MSLFDNPMMNNAMKALTPEQKKEYENIGKYIFSTDYARVNNSRDPEKEIMEAVIYIDSGLKSGLHPDNLSQKELQIMYEIKGSKWYEAYGYSSTEVPANPNPLTMGNDNNNPNQITVDKKANSEIKNKRVKKSEKIEILRQKLRTERKI